MKHLNQIPMDIHKNIEQLLRRYRTSYAICKFLPSVSLCKWVTRRMRTEFGICYCATWLTTSSDGYWKFWLNESLKDLIPSDDVWICKPVSEAVSKPELLDLLRTRINALILISLNADSEISRAK